MKLIILLSPIFLITSCGNDSSVSETETSQNAAKVVAPPKTALKQVFDVRSLLFTSAAQIKQQLGKPTTEDKLTPLQRKMDFPIDMNFEKDSTALTVTYSSKTGKPKEFFLSFPHPTANILLLMQAGGLEEQGSARYAVKPIRMIKDPSFYTGVTITPTR